MPFRDPYEGYYDSYYRPLLARSGFRCVRAWGGFGNEDFSPLLVTLILKSGALFADLTESSPNVLWEVGVAQGAGKRVFLVRNAAHEVPADLAKHLMLPYDPRDEDWVGRAIEQHHLLLLMQAAVMEKLERDPVRMASGLRVAEVGAMVTRTQDMLSDAAFFAMRERGENDANAHAQRGLERIRKRRWADAVTDFTYALEHGAHEAATRMGLGMARLQLEQFADAERDFTLAIDAGFRDALIHEFRAVARIDRNRHKRALSDLDAALRYDPRSLSARQLRARIHATIGNLTEAERDYKAVARRAPHHPSTLGAAGFLHLARRDYHEAATAFRRARQRAFGRAWRFEAGLALLLAGDVDAAAREYEVGLLRATDSQIHEALTGLSHWMGKRGSALPSGVHAAAAAIRRRLRAIAPRSKPNGKATSRSTR
jgi:tetratricopeptide (TPR) repeat protein